MAHLFVIAGHGAGDCGAVGHGYTEAERVRALATKIGELGGDNVTLGDMSRDYYADNGISSLTIPQDWQIVELHMDSGVGTARGGHVIINAGMTPDAYDNALARAISTIFPGRANIIVQRDNLANPARAAAKGYGYRLVECGFISNAEDLDIFNNRMDEVATGILGAFGIATELAEPAKPQIINATVQDNTGAGYMRLLVDQQDDGTYLIKDKENGYLLTAASGSKGANVDFRAFDCGKYQLWNVVKNKYGLSDYTMLQSAANPELYLSVEKNGIGSNNLKLWTDLHNQKQKFFVREESDNSLMLIHAYTGKCVSAKE